MVTLVSELTASSVASPQIAGVWEDQIPGPWQDEQILTNEDLQQAFTEEDVAETPRGEQQYDAFSE